MATLQEQNPSYGFQPGDHVCAFYKGGRDSFYDIVVDYATAGLQAGNKVFCMVDAPPLVHGRIPAELASRADSLHVLTEDEAYMPDGHFTRDAFIRNMEAMVHKAFADGYDHFRAVGDETFVVRHGVDINEWFAAEAELNRIVPGYPHFFFCLYDLDLFDGNTVMHVMRTHPRIYVNGIIIPNPHYSPADQLPG